MQVDFHQLGESDGQCFRQVWQISHLSGSSCHGVQFTTYYTHPTNFSPYFVKEKKIHFIEWRICLKMFLMFCLLNSVLLQYMIRGYNDGGGDAHWCHSMAALQVLKFHNWNIFLPFWISEKCQLETPDLYTHNGGILEQGR